MATFKEIEKTSKIVKQIKKVGLSLGLIFNKDEIKKFNLSYNAEIDLSNANIIKARV